MTSAKMETRAAMASAPIKSDAELVAACAAGDREAFRPLYRRHVQKVRSILARLAGPGHLDDMTQEVFLRAWRHIGGLRASDSVGSWIYRVAVNVAIDQLRIRRASPFVLVDADITGPDEVKAHESRQLVQVVLASLDFTHRSVLVLHDLEQLTEAEIADVLEIPRGTVKSRLFHARARVRKQLGKKGWCYE